MIRRQLITALDRRGRHDRDARLRLPVGRDRVRAGRVPQQGQRLAREGQRQGRGLVAARSELHRQGRQPAPEVLPVPAVGPVGYDASASSASNLGPSNPNLIGNIPGVSITDQDEPVRDAGRPVLRAGAGDRQGRQRHHRQGRQPGVREEQGRHLRLRPEHRSRAGARVPGVLNGLGANVKVPVDAVTASASGLDPDISIANADLQARASPRPATSRSPRSWRRSRRTPTAAPRLPRREGGERARAQPRARQARTLTRRRPRAESTRMSSLLVLDADSSRGRDDLRPCATAASRPRAPATWRSDAGWCDATGMPPSSSIRASEQIRPSPSKSSAPGPTHRSSSCRRRTNASHKVALLDAGADDYVTRPFDPEELARPLAAVLRRARSRRSGRSSRPTSRCTSPTAGSSDPTEPR